MNIYRVWRTVSIVSISIPEIRQLLREQGHEVDRYATRLLDYVVHNPDAAPFRLDLTRLSPEMIGYGGNPPRRVFYEHIRSLGLEPVPAVVGPILRLQYEDQPEGEELAIGMEPIVAPGLAPEVFSLAHRGECTWLKTIVGEYVWPRDLKGVFVRPGPALAERHPHSLQEVAMRTLRRFMPAEEGSSVPSYAV